MHRVVATAIAVLTVVVLILGMVLWSAQRTTNDRLDTLLCLERIHATAAIAVMVPEARADVDARVESARTLGQQLDGC